MKALTRCMLASVLIVLAVSFAQDSIGEIYTVATGISSYMEGYSSPNLEPNSARRIARTSNGSLWAAYLKTIEGIPNIFLAQFSDQDKTWLEQAITESEYNQQNPSIAIDSKDNIHIVWQGRFQGNNSWQIRYRKYDSAQGEWQDIENLTSEEFDQQNPSIAIDSQDNIHIVWSGKIPGYTYSQIRYQKYTDSWQTIEKLSDQEYCFIPTYCHSIFNQDRPVLAIDSNDNLHLVWRGQNYWSGVGAGGTSYGIYYRKYAGSWQNIKQLKKASFDKGKFLSVAIDDDNNVHIVWERTRAESDTGQWFGPYQIWYQRYTTTWEAPIILHETARGLNEYQEQPSVSLDSEGNIYVVWYGRKKEDLKINYKIYFKQYIGSWQETEILVADGLNQYPNLIFGFWPKISGQHTNIPKTGYAFLYQEGGTLKFYSSPNLSWPENQSPNQPINSSPEDGATDVNPTSYKLEASPFSDPDGDFHAASQWQITTVSGDYSSPAFDSGRDTENLTSITIPSGILNYSTTYCWRVRHQDNYGAWSEWSAETSFTTPNQLPLEVKVPNFTSQPGETIIVPISVSDVTELDLIAVELTLTYNPNILTARKVIIEGTLTEGWTSSVNITNGQIVIWMASTTAPSGSGTLVSVEFQVSPNAKGGQTSPLTLSKVRFNEGRITTTTVDGVFTVDDIPPETTIFLSGTQGDNDWYISDVAVTLSAADTGSGVKETKYKINTAPWQTYTFPFPISTEGITTVYYYSVDNANNQESERSKKLKIDKTKPTGTISINDGAEITNSTSVALTLSANDTGSGMGVGTQMKFSNDGSSWSTPEPYSTSKEWQLTSGKGEKTVYVKYKDVAGNWSEIGVSDGIMVITGPRTIYIATTGDDATGDGSEKHPYRTIQKGIDEAFDGDMVLVADGRYTGPGNKNLDFKGKAITVTSENGAENCIIDCEGDGRGFYFHSGETEKSVVSGFTITNGSHSLGGGIYCNSSSPTIENNIITQNFAGPIAGDGGGGIACLNTSSPIIKNNEIIGNSGAEHGGGILCWKNSSPVIQQNTITGNSIDYNGGGISCEDDSSPTIINNIIARNLAENGGGIYCDNKSSPMIVNNTITDNSAGFKGGAIYSSDSNPVIYNSILWANIATNEGVLGGYEIEMLPPGFVTATYSDIQGGWEGEGNINANPLFVDAENGDYHLRPGSPCIDAGDPTSDYSNEPEPNGSRINMGTYGNTPEATISQPFVVDAGEDKTICHPNNGGETQIGGNPTASGGTPPYTYSWDHADSLDDASIANPTATPSTTTTYTVTVTDSSTPQQQGSDTVTVTVYPELIANAGDDKEINSGDTVQIGGNPTASGGTSPYTYSWQPADTLDDATNSNPNATPTETTTYTVTVTDAHGCVDTDEVTVTILYTLTTSVNPAGSGSISLNPSGGTYDAGSVVTLTANPNPDYEFDHWSGDLSGSDNPTTITMNSDKNVTAHFKESDGNSNDNAILAIDFVYEDNMGANSIESTKYASLGSNFYAYVVAQDVVNLATYNVVITFDSSILKYENAYSKFAPTLKNIFEKDGGHELGLQIDATQATTGKLILTNSLQGTEHAPSGNGLLAILEFTREAPGTTTITFGSGAKDNYLISTAGIEDTSYITGENLQSGTVQGIVADIASAQGECIPDGYVDGFDLYTMGAHWHHTDASCPSPCPSGHCPADIASPEGECIPDGYVDGFDLYTMGAHWHEGTPPAPGIITATTTPEGITSNNGAILAVDFVYEDNSGADTIENTTNIAVGKSFYAYILAQNVVNLATYNVVINFDPSILTYVEADSGSEFSLSNILESEGGKMLGLMIDDSDAVNGKLELTNTLEGKDNPPSGNGLLGLIKFTVQSASKTKISFGTSATDNYLISAKGIADTSFISNGELLNGVVNQTNWGDVTGDGHVTAYDASLVLQYVVGLIKLSLDEQAIADVTGDNTVSALDATLILQYTVGLITQFPVETKTAAPVFNAQSEENALIKAIAQLEATALNREQKKVLERLKNLVFKKSLPKHTALLQNFPNPFNPDTWIPYQLAEDSEVKIHIFSIDGTLVRTLSLGVKPAGYYINRNQAAYWNGKNEVGEKASSGLYFYTIKAGKQVATRKMILVK